MICSSNGGEAHPQELSLVKWISIINECIDLGSKFFSISGGEPFACSYFKDMCNYLSKRKIPFSIYTSGNIYDGKLLPLKQDDIIFLSKLGLLRLVFSLEGSNNLTHDMMTQMEGSFKNILYSIKLAKDFGLNIEVHFVPTALNYRELSDVVSLSRELGVNKVSVLRFVPQARGKLNEQLLKLSSNDLIILKEILADICESDSYVRLGSPFSPFLFAESYKCNAGQKRMTIRYDGRVVPCEAMKFMADKFQDNDLKIYSLKYVWENSRIFNLARNFENVIKKTECYSCNFFNKCGGGCPAQRLLNGALTDVDQLCTPLIQLARANII